MAILRLSHRSRLIDVPCALLLFGAGCAAPQRVPEPVASSRPPETCLLVVKRMPTCSDPGQAVMRDLRAEVARALHESGGFRVVETEFDDPLDPVPANARGVAALAGTRCVFLLRLQHLKVLQRVHHVREYLDGSAAGELCLARLPGGATEGVASEAIQLSVRSRHGTFEGTRSLLARRLANRLVEKCLASR